MDGTGSYDPDGDVLSYSWYDELNDLIASGAEPNVWFGPGIYEVSLVVNDGIEDSEPNSCMVMVIEALEADVKVLPQTLNVKRQCRQIAVWMQLPEGIGMEDLDADELMVLAEGNIEPVCQQVLRPSWWTGDRVGVLAFYDVDELGELAGGTTLELTAAMRLASGQAVYGSDEIRVIDPQPRRKRQNQKQSKQVTKTQNKSSETAKGRKR